VEAPCVASRGWPSQATKHYPTALGEQANHASHLAAVLERAGSCDGRA
jgi:hypothetical protein